MEELVGGVGPKYTTTHGGDVGALNAISMRSFLTLPIQETTYLCQVFVLFRELSLVVSSRNVFP
jgi:hypothetical protein